jgi:hypothetical protein
MWEFKDPGRKSQPNWIFKFKKRLGKFKIKV